MKKENLIICPVYNEGNTLQEFYVDLRRFYSQDVLFIDDGSTDNGKDLLLNIKDDKTFTIRHPKRRGYGAALISGFNFVLDKGYERIVVIDADLQHNPQRIPVFLRELSETEVVLGSRYIRINKSLEVPRERMLINRYIAGLINTLFHENVTDPFCGYRGYRDSFLKKAELKEKSYGLGLEIILEVIRAQTPFREIPVEVIYLDHLRKFLDGLDNPSRRLLYYLEIVSRKKKDIENECAE